MNGGKLEESVSQSAKFERKREKERSVKVGHEMNDTTGYPEKRGGKRGWKRTESI